MERVSARLIKFDLFDCLFFIIFVWVRVDLSGCHELVSEQLLDRTDVGHSHKLAGERVSEHVWVDGAPDRLPAGGIYDPLHLAGCQW